MNLYKGKNWEVVFVDWCQDFLGNCIISSNKESLSDLTDEDWVELGKIEKELERVSKKVFNATMFNFACLMNDAYKNNEKAHVHFHFIPRYKYDVKIFNKTYRDKHFGYNLWKWSLSKFSRQRDIFNKEEKAKIFEMMKNEFKIDNCQTRQ
jgi:diadenosine tetraphosphate (Ap4A) HIT family hydrolase